MGSRIGIIAGSGEFPLLVIEEARKLGYSCAVAGIKGEADKNLRDKVDVFKWIDVGEILNLVSFFRENRIKEAIFAGKVDHRVIFKKEKICKASFSLLAGKEKTPSSIVNTIIDFLAGEGIKVKDPTLFISSLFCQEGILTETEPSVDLEEDIAFGWKIVKKIADLDIGQTVIVKDKAVVAVEGIEGTDEAIKRGGRLAGEGIVVVKVSRSLQDARVDLPAIGLETVKSLVEVKGRALCFEAQKVPFFQREEAIPLADANNISIVVRKT